jgi:hypothetical protein
MLDFILTGNSEGRTLTVAFPDFSTRVFTEETPGFENIIDVILDQTGDDFETADLIISIIADDNTDDPDSVCPDDCTCEDNVDLVDNDVPSLKSIICDLARMFESENSEEVNSSSKSADIPDTDTQPLSSGKTVESNDNYKESEIDSSTDDDKSHDADSKSVPVDSLEDLLALLGINLTTEDDTVSDDNDTSGSEPESHFCNRACSDVMSNYHHEAEYGDAESDLSNSDDSTSGAEADQHESTPGSNGSPFAGTINSVVLGRVIPVRIPVSQANFSGYTGPGPFMRI